jgi:hypothetical protein
VSANVHRFTRHLRHECDPYAPFVAAATSSWLSNVSTGLVVVNMALMCMPYYGMSNAYAAHNLSRSPADSCHAIRARTLSTARE